MAAQPLLSAAIIVKDEADHLRRCLASIRDVCDEIVVVDTGSSDESPQVANEFGAVTGVRQWDGDFSAARNAALDLVTGRWVLYIDADEVLEPVDAAEARAELVGNDDAIALQVLFRTRLNFTPYREYRLWKARDDLRFQGRIHETLVPQILRVQRDEGAAIRETDLFALTHDGYEGDQHAKHLRNLPLLQQQVVDLPTRVYLWNHLARVLAALDRNDEALEAWNTGIQLIRQRGIVDRVDGICYVDLTMHLIARGVDASGLIDEGLAAAPYVHSLHWAKARNDIAHERYRDAIESLQRLIDLGPDLVDPVFAYQTLMFTEWPAAALGECRFELREFEAAADAFDLAARYRPDSIEYRIKATSSRSLASSMAPFLSGDEPRRAAGPST